jgi:quercetin dioxygenase-like cupin family protein
VTGEETGGRFAIVEAVATRDAASPRHRHLREDELLYVLEGALHVLSAGAWADIPAGAAVRLPRGVEHAVVATEGARVLAILTPAGFEGFYGELAAAEPAGVPVPGVERLVATAARFGCEITGPPPSRRRSATRRPRAADKTPTCEPIMAPPNPAARQRRTGG